MRIIGDVHGKFDEYFKIIDGCKKSIQLGDFGFNYPQVDLNHRFIAGNHDHHEKKYDCLNYLGDFGTYSNGLTYFFVSGGFSIDRCNKTEGVNWFQNEQLSYHQLGLAIELYRQIKPDYVISHECPYSITPLFNNSDILERFGFSKDFKSMTSVALQTMYEIHKPKAWWFGHHHQSFIGNINGTRFRCLAELEYEDIV